MATNWRHPGRIGALVYAIVATLVGGLVAVVSRVQVAKARGRSDAARRLPDGAIIVISNHTSYVDGVLLALVCRRLGRSLRLLATAGVFRAPVLGGLARRIGFIPVDRGASTAADALDAAVQALDAGEAVGIFPEGRLTRDPSRWPERAKTGAVRLALRSGAPIVPVAMVGAHRVLDRGHVVSQLITNVLLRPRVSVSVGSPIDPAAWNIDADDPVAVRRVTDDVMAELIALVEELRGELSPAPTGVVDESRTTQSRTTRSRSAE
jgi:1-acyl-sn-glycerol-3-phosphate acyltransferase